MSQPRRLGDGGLLLHDLFEHHPLQIPVEKVAVEGLQVLVGPVRQLVGLPVPDKDLDGPPGAPTRGAPGEGVARVSPLAPLYASQR